jgi:PAS domain S-box-containing protein
LPGWQDNEELVAAGKRALEFDRAAIERGPGAELAPTERERLGRTYLLNQQAFADSAGRTVGVLATGIDVTETKTMEAALKRAERDAADRAKMFVELIDALPVSIAMRDTEGRFLQVNRTWERYFNIRREDAIGRRFPELPGWREGEELEAAAKRSVQLDLDAIARGPTAAPVAGEGHRLGRSYVVSRQVFSDSMGRMTAVLATGVDITESKAMEAALKQAEHNAADRAKFISEIGRRAADLVAMRDLEGRYVLVNRMWERFYWR